MSLLAMSLLGLMMLVERVFSFRDFLRRLVRALRRSSTSCTQPTNSYRPSSSFPIESCPNDLTPSAPSARCWTFTYYDPEDTGWSAVDPPHNAVAWGANGSAIAGMEGLGELDFTLYQDRQLISGALSTQRLKTASSGQCRR